MTKQAKQTGRALSLNQIAKETGVPIATLRLWETRLGVFARNEKANQYGPNDVAAARALKRFLELDGQTLEDARRLIDAAGPSALIAALGRAPERTTAESPARKLQDSIHKAAAAGLFGDVVAPLADKRAPTSETNVSSLNRARVARLMVANDPSDRKRG